MNPPPDINLPPSAPIANPSRVRVPVRVPVRARRVVIIVLDGFGCGELPDADRYGDCGSNTLGNLSRAFEDGLRLPNMGALGLGNIIPVRGTPPRGAPGNPEPALGGYGKCGMKSGGKDSTSGHWEIAGVVLPEPFPTYPDGFPPEIMDAFTARIGRGALGNKAASGTEIIKELGGQHLRTGDVIVYTSADSVFQIAAHVDVVPLPELYRICEIAREILTGPHRVGRVIARPFAGAPGAFRRTTDRRDFSVKPPPNLLDDARTAGIRTVGVGKIGDLFAHQGLDEEPHTASNMEGMDVTIERMGAVDAPSLIFTNLVEGDMIYGHRNDTAGYRRALEEFDARLPELFAAQRPGDLMIITSDHGVDPTTPSTDHSREYVPLLAWGAAFRRGVDLGARASHADVGASAAEWLGIKRGESLRDADQAREGISFLKSLLYADLY